MKAEARSTARARRVVRRSPLAGLLAGLLLGLPGTACSRGSVPEAAIPEPPPDFATLESGVRDQFARVVEGVQLLDRSMAPAGERAAAWGELGHWFHVYGYPEGARDAYLRARELAPGDGRWPFYLAELALGAGDGEEAAALLRTSAALAPENPEPLDRLAEAAMERGDLAGAEEIWSQILRRRSADPGARFGLAKVAVLEERPADAVVLLRSLLAERPDATPVLFLLAQALQSLGQVEEASAVRRGIPEDQLLHRPLVRDEPWTRDLRRADRGSRALNRRGLAALRSGETREAAIWLGQAVASTPERLEVRIHYGQALSRLGHLEAAREQWREVVRQREEEPALAALALSLLGTLAESEGHLADAIHHLEAALEIDPEAIPPRLTLARIHLRRSEPAAASEHYLRLRSAPAATRDVRFWAAATQLALGRVRVARELLAEDLRLLGPDRLLGLLFARALAVPGPDGSRDLETAGRLLGERPEPRDLLYLETAAMVAAASGRFHEAEAHQDEAVAQAAALGAERPSVARSLQRARRRSELYRQGEAAPTAWEALEALLPSESPTEPGSGGAFLGEESS